MTQDVWRVCGAEQLGLRAVLAIGAEAFAAILE
jgi:hypothetical protein